MTEFDEKIFLALVARVYDAALDATLWTSTVDAIRRAIGGEVGILFHVDRRPDPIGANVADLLAHVGYDAAAIDSYERHFASRGVRVPALLAKPPGSIYADDRDFAFAQVKTSEIYTDFYLPLRAGGQGIGMNLFSEEKRVGCLFAHKPTHALVRPGDIALFEALTPHIVRALQLQRQVGATQLRRDSGNRALGAMGIGLILAGRKGNILFANAVAEAILREGDALTMSGGMLRARDPAQGPALAAAIAQAVDLATGQSLSPGVTRRLERGTRTPLSLLVCPMRTVAATFGIGHPAALIMLHDPEARGSVSPQTLAKLYGLTPAEAALLAALLDGERLGDFAEAKGTSLATAKTQLQHIFDKMGQNRQSDLVREVLANPLLHAAGGP